MSGNVVTLQISLGGRLKVASLADIAETVMDGLLVQLQLAHLVGPIVALVANKRHRVFEVDLERGLVALGFAAAVRQGCRSSGCSISKTVVT